jgi:hypothetical protein
MHILFQFTKLDDDSYFELSGESVKAKFTTWVKSRDKFWLESTKSDDVIRIFLQSFEGLNATTGQEHYNKLCILLKPLVYTYKYM